MSPNVDLDRQCKCGWVRPLIAVTTIDGKLPPPGLVPAYVCPKCALFHVAAEVSEEEAARVFRDLRDDLTRMWRMGAKPNIYDSPSPSRLAGKSLAQVHACFAQFACEVRDRLNVAAESGQPIATTDGIDGAAYAAAMTVSMMRQKQGYGKDIEAELREARAIFGALAQSFASAANRAIQ